jgi:hypothetical protein
VRLLDLIFLRAASAPGHHSKDFSAIANGFPLRSGSPARLFSRLVATSGNLPAAGATKRVWPIERKTMAANSQNKYPADKSGTKYSEFRNTKRVSQGKVIKNKEAKQSDEIPEPAPGKTS